MKFIAQACTVALTLLPQVTSFSVSLPTGQLKTTRLPAAAVPTSGTAEEFDRADPDSPLTVRPNEDSECRLIVLQITDVYTLENFANFKTLLNDVRENANGAQVVCMLTGDFLSPYLLSSLDRGKGMMNALNSIPLDYLSWGNHEADIDHRTVCRHVRNFKGTWLNSNMIDHEAMKHQQEYDIIDLCSRDGSQQRKVGLCAVLSDDPALYSQFSAPGAFGGATITDPWEALKKYDTILKEKGCDFVLPLEHLYVPEDEKTCRDFDFPVVLSGHDHHMIDEVIEGTRLLKPGMNGDYSTVLDISWKNGMSEKPEIKSRFVNVANYQPDPELAEINEKAYDVLLPMRNTELAPVPKSFEPLSSNLSRESVTTMGKFICSLIKSSMNSSRRSRKHKVDATLLMGGNIRGNMDYEPGSFFSLEALEAEVKSDEIVGVVEMPGWLLKAGVEATHMGDPKSGWMQYDIGVKQAENGITVTHVGNKPIELQRTYRVATKIPDLTNGQSPPWTEYYSKRPELLPPRGACVNIHSELMSYFARNLWRTLWEVVSYDMDDDIAEGRDEILEEGIAVVDQSGTGEITVPDIMVALRDRLGLTIDSRERALAEFVHDYADMTGDGIVTKDDLKIFFDDLNEGYERDSWRMGFSQAGPPDTLTKQVFDELIVEEAINS